MQPVKRYVAIALLSLAALIFVGMPALSLCTVVHGVVSSQLSAFHLAAWFHIGVLVLLAYYFYDFFDWPRR